MLVPGPLFAPLCNLRGRSARYVLFIEFERYLFASVVYFLALVFVLYYIFLFLAVIMVPSCTVWRGGGRFTPTLSGILNTRRYHPGQQRSQHDEHSIKTRRYTTKLLDSLCHSNYLRRERTKCLNSKRCGYRQKYLRIIIHHNGFDAKLAQAQNRRDSTMCLHFSKRVCIFGIPSFDETTRFADTL